MKVADIKELAERQAFRPFAVRLNNGVQSTFHRPRNFGAPEDCRMIFFLGETEAARNNTDRIVEIIDRPA